MHSKTDIEWLIKECAEADSFAELLPIAMAELRRFKDGAEMVCGPITTGGLGNPDANLKVFNAIIKKLLREGSPIFSQMPYEERISFFKQRWWDEDPAHANQYYMPILEEFYRPLMQMRVVKRAWFIPRWESSFGATWERKELASVGSEISDLTGYWVEDILAAK